MQIRGRQCHGHDHRRRYRSLRRAAVATLLACLLAPANTASAAADPVPLGWAQAAGGTTGGAGGTTWTVHDRGELKTALANSGRPTAPKVIRVVGAIDGFQSDDGRHLGEQDYPGGTPGPAVAGYGGEHVRDTGSWCNGRPADLATVAAGLGPTGDVGWDPADAYAYRQFTTRPAVVQHVLRHAGAGRP